MHADAIENVAQWLAQPSDALQIIYHSDYDIFFMCVRQFHWKIIPEPELERRITEAWISLQGDTPSKGEVGRVRRNMAVKAIQAWHMDAPPLNWNVFREHEAIFEDGILWDRITGETRPASTLMYIRVIPHIPYPPSQEMEEPPRWNLFLNQIFAQDPDKEQKKQLLHAWIVNMLMFEHTPWILWLYGTGRNGKGVLLHLLEQIFPHITVDIHRQQDPLYQLEALDDVKLVSVPETSAEKASQLLRVFKQITGGDIITTRAIYGRPRTIRPTHVRIVVLSNALPTIDQRELTALSGRIIAIHFKNSFEGREDLTLESTLHREREAIVAQAMREQGACYTTTLNQYREQHSMEAVWTTAATTDPSLLLDTWLEQNIQYEMDATTYPTDIWQFLQPYFPQISQRLFFSRMAARVREISTERPHMIPVAKGRDAKRQNATRYEHISARCEPVQTPIVSPE